MRVRRGLWLRYYRVSLAGDQIHTFGLISTGRVCWPSHNVILQGRKYSNGTAFPSPSPASMFCVFFFSIVNEYLTGAVPGNGQPRTTEGHSWARADLIFLFQVLDSNPDTAIHTANTSVRHRESSAPQAESLTDGSGSSSHRSANSGEPL